jgi:ATP-dependent Lon protease
MRDEAEIKGHRRTYVGAMPGKLIQGLKYTGTSNPVIMIDEVDKMSSSHHFGDPSSAVLEVLDPEQNQEFQDHYLDVRFDLSNVLFILTANTTDTIPAALLDRLEVIRLSGYIESEKMQIAKRYLIPKHLKEVGLKKSDVLLKAEALHRVINDYCRESGVRNFEKKISRILRKIATKKVREMEKSGTKTLPANREEVTKANVETYLGKPAFTSERYYGGGETGVTTGLAWTSMGGSILYIEAVGNKAKDRSLRITGNLGDVMKESSSIAWTYLLSRQTDYLPKEFDSTHLEMNLHVPEGATPKDGPSAGITIVTSMISMITEKPVPDDIGMTGEITLTGKVLAIGGLKEKLIAAKREHLKRIIIPKRNKPDYAELPEHIKKGLKIYFVDDCHEVYDIVFSKAKKSPAKRKTKRPSASTK